MGLIRSAATRVMPFDIPLRADFPPAHLIDSRPLEHLTVAQLEERTRRLKKLENLYHKGQALAWDGKKVLQELVQRHGGVHLDREKAHALANIFTIIMWGELGAWEVASYLAEHIRDHTEAKMAATIQTFDEARHYYVMRDYLKLLDVGDLPQPNSFVKSMLAQLIHTDSILYKLVGMQLFVEHVAIHLFRALSEVGVEPVLADLLHYFHRDEARHIGLGKLYLPEILPKLSRREAIQLQMYQLWLVTFMQLSIEYHRGDAELLGLDIRAAMMRALRDQTLMLEEIRTAKGVRGVVLTPRRLRFVNKWLLDQLWSGSEPSGQAGHGLSRPVIRRARERMVRTAERVWARMA